MLIKVSESLTTLVRLILGSDAWIETAMHRVVVRPKDNAVCHASLYEQLKCNSIGRQLYTSELASLNTNYPKVKNNSWITVVG